jgi:pantetheine-phosphate adenylyltransferase
MCGALARDELLKTGGKMRSVAVYPGSFDPITNGHIDLLERALKIFDIVIIAVAANTGKDPLFSAEERLEMIKESLAKHPLHDRVKSDLFHGLLVDYVESISARTIVRGLRAVSDFEYEFQMALMNRKLNANIETAYIMTGMRWIYISSRIIKEVVRAGGNVSGLVPVGVEKKLADSLAGLSETSL